MVTQSHRQVSSFNKFTLELALEVKSTTVAVGRPSAAKVFDFIQTVWILDPYLDLINKSLDFYNNLEGWGKKSSSQSNY